MDPKANLNPLSEPEVAREKATAENATIQDLAVSLVDMLKRARDFDGSGNTVHARALLGLCQRHRTVLALVERHILASIKAIDGKGSTTGMRPRSPLSLRRIRQTYSHTEPRRSE